MLSPEKVKGYLLKWDINDIIQKSRGPGQVLLKHHYVHQKVVGPIPGQGMYPCALCCRFDCLVTSQEVYGEQLIDVSLSHLCFSLSPSFSLFQIYEPILR